MRLSLRLGPLTLSSSGRRRKPLPPPNPMTERRIFWSIKVPGVIIGFIAGCFVLLLLFAP